MNNIEWKDIKLPILRKRLLQEYIYHIDPDVSKEDVNRFITIVNLAISLRLISNEDIHINQSGDISTIDGLCYDKVNHRFCLNRQLQSSFKYSLSLEPYHHSTISTIIRLWNKYIKTILRYNSNNGSMYSSKS
jgi:hypothetical protein